jgi:short subunit dehydrogenase-like uncharacterized protein
MEKDIDIIIYGATGFTGKLCVEYLASNQPSVKWAIAGRNKEKLTKVASELCPDIEILIADSEDEEALDCLTQRSKVILSTAGPFHRYGSKLVASCVKNSAHYVDITGENFWVKGLIDKHHDEASRKGIRIIPSCGYDSVPSDLGSFYCARSMNKPLKRIEAFHSFKGDASGGTLETMFSMADLNLGKKLFDPFLLNPEGTVTDEQKALSRDKASVTSQDKINGWSGPFIMAAANTRVVRRSAALLDLSGQSYGSKFTYQEFAFHKKKMGAYFSLAFLGLFGLVLMTPLRKIVRPLMKKPGEGPSLEVRENGWFSATFKAEAEDGEVSIFKMHGKGDPGYKVTSKLVAESALCLVENESELPEGAEYGGILTSASGLGDAYIKRLKKVGIHFEGPLE